MRKNNEKPVVKYKRVYLSDDEIKSKKVYPNGWFIHYWSWEKFTNIDEDEKWLEGKGDMRAIMTYREKVIFNKFWRDRGCFEYAKWLAENKCAYGNVTKSGDIVVYGESKKKGNEISEWVPE